MQKIHRDGMGYKKGHFFLQKAPHFDKSAPAQEPKQESTSNMAAG